MSNSASEKGCTMVSQSKLIADMGVSKSYLQSQTKKGVFESYQLPGQRKRYYCKEQIADAIRNGSKSKQPTESPKSTASESA